MGASQQRREVCRYGFYSYDGRLIFQKVRFDPKSFAYYDVLAARWSKPRDADSLIYNLPRVLKATEQGEAIHWAEGEKDADALMAAGVVATSVHQGAGKATQQQARWMRESWQPILIWVDKDAEHPEVGAYDACLRHDRLREVGFDGEIVFLRAAGAWGKVKDAADHLAAGFTVAQAIVVDESRLKKVAARYTARAGRRAGYGR